MTVFRHANFRVLSTVLALLAGIIGVAVAGGAQAAVPPNARIDLRVLVVDDGGPSVAAIAQTLSTEMVPFTRISLANANRPVITPAFLFESTQRAKFQAVVLPNEGPQGLSAAELTALHDFERAFGVRQVDASTWAHPGVGLNWATHIGSLDGMTGAVTDAGKASGLGYLNGPVPFPDVAPDVLEAYGFLATPQAGFQPLVEMPIPNSTDRGSLVGVYNHDGREEMVITFAYNLHQQQFQAIAHGIVGWMTRGVNLGQMRYRFSVHVDDLFLPDDRWSTTHNCTVGDDCPSQVPPNQPIRMTPADVDAAVAWQNRSGFQMQMAFNGFGSIEAGASDPLTTKLVAAKNQFWWINHTYSHPYLGCVQDFSTTPWRCARGLLGIGIRWVSWNTIQSQIGQNTSWGAAKGLPFDRAELVTGEHSGLKSLPQMTTDNPNLSPSLDYRGITSIASDASREPTQRKIGPALTVPRHPMNIFYNVATKAEEVDEYNWIYTSRANGGSGICENNPSSTCITPLSPTTGFDEYIVPIETRIALDHVLSGSMRPHYAHQSNLAEDRILYPVLDGILGEYRRLFAANTPLLNPKMKEIAAEMNRQRLYAEAVAAGRVSGYRIGNVVTVVNSGGSGVDISVTAPQGSRLNSASGALWGSSYAGEQSTWHRLGGGGTVRVVLPE